jgi:hypothetical protein
MAMGACRQPTSIAPDGVRADARGDAGVAKDALCSATFGDAMTNAHGRVDGIITAVVEPGNTRCVQANNDHVVVQVRFNNAIYRMVVNIESNGTVAAIRMRTLPHDLVGPTFAEGWHPNVNLDYANDLGVHSDDVAWQAEPLAAASRRVADALIIGAPISVFATSTGGTFASGAHLVHRTATNVDGALVVAPTSDAPEYMLFHFADQSF